MKLLITGGSSGKTSYLNRLKEKYDSEDGIKDDEEITYIKINQGNKIEIHVDFLFEHNIVYDRAIIMYDNYYGIDYFKNIILDKYGNIPILVLYNKCDINGVIEKYNNYKKQNPDSNVMYCSAEKDINIRESFEHIIGL